MGVTRFSPSDVNSWFQVLGGLIIQGGRANAVSSAGSLITFTQAFPKQVLCILACPIGVNSTYSVVSVGTNLENFVLDSGTNGVDYYWFAIGL